MKIVKKIKLDYNGECLTGTHLGKLPSGVGRHTSRLRLKVQHPGRRLLQPYLRLPIFILGPAVPTKISVPM